MAVLNFSFRNEYQEEYFWGNSRNTCFSGGFGNGKTYVACLKATTFLLTFPKYRIVIGRKSYKDLTSTTMTTMWKVLPEEYIESHNQQTGLTVLKNGSEILWMHFDKVDENSLRGLEINAAIIDQAEEIDEPIFLILDSRIGRWDMAEVPAALQADYLKTHGTPWPLRPDGKLKIPTFLDLLCNPDTKYHFIYIRFHIDSLERNPEYRFISAPTDPSLNDEETIKNMMGRDPEWIAKYFKGEWGVSNAQIHLLRKDSLIELGEDAISRDWLKKFLAEAALFRCMDHGDSSPTCVLWVGAWRGVYIFYREYYVPNTIISRHRSNIVELSRDEYYVANYADPSIFHKASQKDGGYWSIADEYLNSNIPGPPLSWIAADNNEFATRNRINELLAPSERFLHPFTGAANSPGIYFIKKSGSYPQGCFYAITQLAAQRREVIGSDNGRTLYSDERDENVPDHAYDPIRYFISMHGVSPADVKKEPPKRSFAAFNKLLLKRNRSNRPASAA